jgi:DNA-binding NtrC family response regulator
MPAQILIVDDDPAERRRLEEAAVELGHAVTVFGDGASALARLDASGGDRFDLMILDLVMPELDGIGVLRRIAEKGSRIKVIVQAAPSGIDMAASAIRAGASDFLIKPAAPKRIAISIQNVLRIGALEREIARIDRAAAGALEFRDLIAASPSMERVLSLGRRAAAATLPILIEGEPGVGKARIARTIHGSGDRRSRPFVAVHCGANSSASVENILFGTDRVGGRLQEAQGGTLLLREIGELPLEAQARLLRVLQAGETEPAGGRRAARIDIRLIATTSRDLIAEVQQGRFREDLYYRLNALPIRVPPLRERQDDIPELTRHFALRFAAEEAKAMLRGIDPDALERLRRQAWPGNIRQLENAVYRAVVLADGPLLTMEDFPRIAASLPGPAAPADKPTSNNSGRPAAEVAILPPPALPEAGHLRAIRPDGDVRPLAEIEAAMIELALERYRGRMATVARKLGIGRSTLYRKLKELGIAEDGENIAAE